LILEFFLVDDSSRNADKALPNYILSLGLRDIKTPREKGVV
jgi:hypothetical protein